ncbi:MAG: transcriptional repressor [Candidatus Taylorbacteria bacterium]|nr:transcriptional repressor [Candidatus Taylorbacteria bacterium]
MKHEYFSSVLKKCGVKVTKQRVAILEVFEEGCKPISAEGIFGVLKKSKKVSVDLATIYRNLQVLEAHKVIRRVDLRGDSQLYELGGHHHHHILCTACGATEGFDFCIANTIEKHVVKQSKKFKVITEHAVELFGICSECVSKSKK